MDAWYNSNPSLGFHLTERKIEAELGEDKLDHNVQRLGYWPSYNQKSAISAADWDGLKVDGLPDLKGRLFAAVKYGQDGSNAAMSIAVRTTDGRIFVEAIDCQSVRNGNRWIINFLRNADVEQIVIDGASRQKILDEELREYHIRNVVLPTVNKRSIGSSGGFGYRSQFDDMDISVMDSALLAHWACATLKPRKKQKVSY